jgi:hypothetical protein
MNGSNEELKSVENDNECQKALPLWRRICRRCDHMMTELYADMSRHTFGGPPSITASLIRSFKEPLPKQFSPAEEMWRPGGWIYPYTTWKDPVLAGGIIILIVFTLTKLFRLG